jgi:menaquinone-dependent protoporphyrinogen oxidase
MKTVIIYATKHGTTKKVADTIAKKLIGEVAVINATDAKSVDIETADRVILGGSFYIGSLQKPLKNFINANLDSLMKKRIALFFCASAPDEKDFEKELIASMPAGLLDVALFKGNIGHEFDFKKMNFIEKFMIGKIMGLKESCSKINNDLIDELVKAIA